MYCTLNRVILRVDGSLFFIKIHGVERKMKMWYFILRNCREIICTVRLI